MDEHLKRVAEASLALGEAEEALEAGFNQAAGDALDAADEALAGLRAAWPGMSAAERTLIGRTAAPLRARLDAARARLPRASALADAVVEVDPEQDADPEAA